MNFRWALAVAFASTSLAVSAGEAPKADPARGQKIAGEVCAACHAADGNSTIAQNPVLAGQHPEYLYRQLAAFKQGGDRPDPVMTAMVANLSPEDMAGLAAFYAAQKAKPRAARNKDTVTLGQQIWRGGIGEKGIPACAGCHGATGAGIPSQYPRLAGQHAEYTDAQMKKWRSEQRKNDANKMMRMIATKMNDQEIAAVSDYIAGLR